jgi:hypothetical protein
MEFRQVKDAASLAHGFAEGRNALGRLAAGFHDEDAIVEVKSLLRIVEQLLDAAERNPVGMRASGLPFLGQPGLRDQLREFEAHLLSEPSEEARAALAKDLMRQLSPFG